MRVGNWADKLDHKIELAAARLRGAARDGRPCAPVRDLLGATDVPLAYAVQAANLSAEVAAGQTMVGRKIGLTAKAVQRQLGVEQPDFGTLLDGMAVEPSGTIPAGRLLQPKVEAEIAFWLSADLTGSLTSVDDVRSAVASASAAIEIVDSRIAGWDITVVDTVADNASSGMFAVSDRRVPLAGFEPASVRMSLSRNGQLHSTGTGADCLGDPLAALLWLARTAKELGSPLMAGEVVLSGALGPMAHVQPGDRVRAEITDLGVIEVNFAGEENAHG